MTGRAYTRWQASGLHLLISAAIAAAVLLLMLAVWYPPPLFEAAGGDHLILILVGVDVVIGPLITLIIFRSGKRGLKFDLSAIAAMQLAALIYGGTVVFLARPAFIVFVKDRFEVATAAELEPEELAAAGYPEFRAAPLAGPVFAAGEFPSDQREMQKLVDVALAGIDLQHFPRYYRRYAERTQEILARAQPLATVRASDPRVATIIDDYIRRAGLDEREIRYLPMRARRAWLAVLVDAKTARPVKMLIAERI